MKKEMEFLGDKWVWSEMCARAVFIVAAIIIAGFMIFGCSARPDGKDMPDREAPVTVEYLCRDDNYVIHMDHQMNVCWAVKNTNTSHGYAISFPCEALTKCLVK